MITKSFFSITTICSIFQYFPESFVNISQQAIVSYLCLNLAITPIFIACQTQLMLSVFSVLFFFINTALILIILGLEYLGLAILLVYAGAIIMILLFVIMLVKLQETENQPFATMAPSKWASNVVSFQTKHIQVRSLFLIVVITLGALVLTYSCKSIVMELIPGYSASEGIIIPSLESVSDVGVVSTNLIAGSQEFPKTEIRALFNSYSNPQEPNYIPWLFTYFSTLLEVKFQPLVLETPTKGLWNYLALYDAPSYNLDRWTLNLVGRFGKLHELLPSYKWNDALVNLNTMPSTGKPLESVQNLGDYSTTLKTWDFYPRARYGVYDFPTQPVQLLKQNTDIPLIYAQELEFKDQLTFPRKDITNISSVLYTLHAPTLVLAAVCLFVAMVLSFLLTDFKLKH